MKDLSGEVTDDLGDGGGGGDWFSSILIVI